jgi:type IV pilus assembly protein PilY1
MKPRLVAGMMLAGSLLFGHGAALAEDIDLFVQPAGVNTGVPNVLILLDNTANWNSAFTNEIAALATTINNLPVNPDGTARFRLGLMMFSETGSPNSNLDGGYVRAAIRDLTTAHKTRFVNLVNSLNAVIDRSNSGKAGKTMSEAYQYFSGFAPFDGNLKLKTDYTGNIVGTLASRAIYAQPGNALNSFAGTPYNSPVIDGSCGRNYIIYISNGAVQDSNADNTAANTRLAAAAAAAGITDATTQIPISPNGSAPVVADEWARFMRQSTLGTITYTVDVDRCVWNADGSCRRATNGQSTGWTALLRSMAGVSDGEYFDVNSTIGGGAQISEALARIFSEIQAVNSVFAAVSLPVSIHTQGTFLNQVYVGMFRPDADALPRWPGNMKQYKLGIVAGQLRTLDADDQGLINTGTGFITECARSFWTPTAVDTYWAFRPSGGCLAVANSNSSNFPDGNVVEKGGQAYRLRSTTTRTVKTCSATFGSCSTLTDFDTANSAITEALLGAGSATERDLLIDWHRGQDLDDEDIDAVTSTEMRPSSHGDVLHSRPIAVNYGPDSAPDVVIYYGTNDGVLRAVNGNRTAAIDGHAAGNEIWSFVAPEFYPHIKRLRDNSTPIDFTGATTPPTRAPKPYGFDGPITLYQDASNEWIFAAARRGGRFVYGFNVTEMATNPGNTTLLWKIGCPNQGDDTGCDSDYRDIGQTWSAPQTIKTNGYVSAGVPQPMLIMGGGYDTCEDADPHTCTTTSKGRAVYVLAAASALGLRRFVTDRPVPADVTVVPDSVTGLAKYAYAVDTGGNVYRISGATANVPFDTTAPGDWTITKIASLGCDSAGSTSPSLSCPMNRKFLNAPDVVEDDGVYHLLIGSGDREKPLLNFPAAYATDNHFFMIKDNPTDPDWLSDENTTCGSDIICLDSLVQITSGGADPDAADLATMKGWYLEMRDHEQVVTSAITVFGTTTFSTHTPTIPAVGSCESNLGTARVYNVRFANAAAANGSNNRDEEISGGGLPPSPVAGMVELDDGRIVPFIIGADGDSPLESSLPSAPSTGTQPKSLTYWYIDQ